MVHSGIKYRKHIRYKESRSINCGHKTHAIQTNDQNYECKDRDVSDEDEDENVSNAKGRKNKS